MKSAKSSDPEKLLAEARSGRADSLGALLESYRARLQALASGQLKSRLRARVDTSDLVQETFLQATSHFHDFRGESEQELLSWLRTILRRSLLRTVQRQLLARKRSMSREVTIRYPDMDLISNGSSPSTPLRRRETADDVMKRLSRLPAPLREVLVLRNLGGLPFTEVARQMGRTPGAVRVLWLRALERLRQETKLRTEK
jgi:RNA polymerase sigma-70 factor (ECF subfamily)